METFIIHRKICSLPSIYCAINNIDFTFSLLFLEVLSSTTT